MRTKGSLEAVNLGCYSHNMLGFAAEMACIKRWIANKITVLAKESGANATRIHIALLSVSVSDPAWC